MDKEAVPGRDIVTTIDADPNNMDSPDAEQGRQPGRSNRKRAKSCPWCRAHHVDMLANIGQHYDEISRDPYKPMFNRAVQAPYPPGSVFKLVNGLIGLQEGTLRPEMAYPCSNGYHFGSHTLGCHTHRSPLVLEEAVMMSCNSYFCYVLRNVLENKKYKDIAESLDRWNDYVQSFGFGHKLGSDFPAELGGTLPTSKYYNKIYGKGGWKFTTIISISIGQGEVGVTPLQIANFCATVANRGWYRIPHIIKASEGVKIDPKYYEKQYTMVDTLQFKKVIKGMWRAVNSGYGVGATASIAAVPGLDICGKTGTAQNPRGADNSVFICFAPENDPKIAVAAYIENAGFGATWAAPIASLLVEKYLQGEISEERKYLENRILQANLMSGVKID